MGVGTYALITVADYKTWKGILDSDILAEGFSVYGSDGSAATVSKSGTNWVMVKTGGANPGTITLGLALAPTLTQLVAYINIMPGWVANLLGTGAAASSDIENFAATSCLGLANAYTVKYVNNYYYERLVDRATAMIESVLNRNIKSRAYVQERYDGGAEDLFLKNYPITKISQISAGVVGVIRVKYDLITAYNAYVEVTTTGVILTVDGVSQVELTFAIYTTMKTLAAAIDAKTNWTAAVVSSEYDDYPSSLLIEMANLYVRYSEEELEIPDEPIVGYEVEKNEGIVYLLTGFPEGIDNIFVSYTGGYATVPDDIIEACVEVVNDLKNIKDGDVTMKSESMGDYSYTTSDNLSAVKNALSDEVFRKLMGYRRAFL